tara:strand:+ start:616 stop:1056 length:441 start_codon:yes stop_codon:yes gene_type:complete
MGKENQLMRVNNWSSQLEKILEDYKQKKIFKHGKNDCVTFTIDCIEAITGKKVFNKKYKNIKEAKKIIKSLKSKDLLDIALKIAKENNFKTIDLDKAQKGDVFYYLDNTDLEGTLGVCIGESVMFNWRKEIMLIRKTDCKIAWRIE